MDNKLAKMNSESLNLALVTDEFDANMLDENLINEQHVDENDESSSGESDEENMQPPFDVAPDVPVSTGGEGNQSNMPHLAVGLCDVLT
jgi:glutamine phosphoribosylpyrophosphate amidotransferase